MVIFAWFAVVFSWSISWMFASIQARYNIAIEFSLFYRKLFAAIIAFCFALILKQRIRLTKREFWFCFFIGSFHIFLQYIATYCAAISLSSGMMACIGSISPIIIEIILAFLEKRKISLVIFLGSIFGIFGLLLLFRNDISCNSNTLNGIIIAFVMLLINCVGNVVMAKNINKYRIPNVTFLFYIMLIAALMFAITGFVRTGEIVSIPLDSKYIISLLYLSIFASFIAFMGMYYVIEKAGAAIASYTSLAIPLFAMIVSSIFEGYKWDIFGLFGIFLLLSGIYIGIVNNNKKIQE
jgi:drug/metabolite transporter (DMT)-like permease